MRFKIALLSIFLLGCQTLFSQEKESSDSLIRLLSAKKIQLIEKDGEAFRKVEGPARFLHNNTYLICDTAVWNVDKEYLDAVGNVQIIQENTMLTGDRLHYIINLDLAQFRGSLVELKDDKGNSLRTEYLNYNTKDSVATFFHGASMRDSTGNIIESVDGKYESQINLFTFINSVQMFSDSLFFVSDRIKYRTDLKTAYFGDNTKGWKNQNYISSNGGWYNRSNETICFENQVYGQTKDYELWCESLFFDRVNNEALLERNIQVTDTLDGAFIFGDKLEFYDAPRLVRVTHTPALVLLVEEDGKADSLFISADSLLYSTQRMYEVDSTIRVNSAQRRALAEIDVVKNVREKSRQESKDKTGGQIGAKKGIDMEVDEGAKKGVEQGLSEEETPPEVQAEETKEIKEPIEAIEVPLDTTQVKFLSAYHKVKIFKSDNQIACDSLLYSDLDSMARLFKDPIIWNEVKNQLTADSMQLVIKDGEMKKGLMLSNAFLASHESDDYYHQIKAPEMAGFFEGGEVSRFDAMGGASMIVYMADSSVVTYANIKECKIISSLLKNGDIQKNYYFEAINSNMYPIEDMTADNKTLKGFHWRGDERPKSRYDVTTYSVKPSIRKYTLESPYYPLFDYTAKYFPGYMEGIMGEITERETWIWKSTKR